MLIRTPVVHRVCFGLMVVLLLATGLVLAACADDDSSAEGGLDSGRVDAAATSDSRETDSADSQKTDTAGEAGVICTPGEKHCAGAVAEVCTTSGSAWNQLPCPNGCEDGACKPLSLETGWVVHQYDLLDDSIKTPASYAFEQDGLIAVQSANPMASVYYNDTALPEGIRVTGRFSVETTSDDDLIGFAFGWQDEAHYYLFDWKQATQPDSSCGTATAGASLKLVSSSDAIDACEDFWSSAGTSRIKPIVGVEQNPEGWKDNTVYDIELLFRPGDIAITIKEGETVAVSITSNDTTYRSGKFGFFNYSQQAVRYQFFAISPIE